MAKRSTKSGQSRNSNAKRNTENTRSNANAAGARNESRNESAFNFANASKNFSNPSQFFNFSALPNFQPANVQQFVEQLIQTSQKNLEAWTACTQLAVERSKELMEEQADFTNRMMQETAATLQDALSNTNGGDTRNKMAGMSDYAKNFMDQAATHARSTAEENIQLAQRISETLNQRLNETVEELRSAA